LLLTACPYYGKMEYAIDLWTSNMICLGFVWFSYELLKKLLCVVSCEKN